MKKKAEKTVFVCSSCGSSYPKWQGRCPACLEWNTLEEEKELPKSSGFAQMRSISAKPTPLAEVSAMEAIRFPTGLIEFDQVLGGGLVQGSLVLIGGQPGVGKSTLLLQITRALETNETSCLYVSGEESEPQIKLRALRMGISGKSLWLFAESSLEAILNACENLKPKVMILDSIQTIRSLELQSVPGSIAQIRDCTYKILEFAKSRDLTVLIVGHITKDGELAGPKLLEHMVDTVLQFEGDKQHYFRILRSIKNRFGATDEVSVFEMKEGGLFPVENPASYFMAEASLASGSAVSVLLEGSQPFLVEVQALVTDNHFTYPRRTAMGLDLNRLHLLLAVLERHAGLQLGQYDACVNLAGGIKAADPALDLAICAALYSSFNEKVLPKGVLFLGEVGLGGEVRMPSRLDLRVRTAIRQGIVRFVLPKRAMVSLGKVDGVDFIGVQTVQEALHVQWED
ncbi:MAG: DNA repair protein RadA [Candidatus Cloacimonetes bacterium]|nr:DNA repair protein RadA [Candidatus Cloacimonadota bacterium]